MNEIPEPQFDKKINKNKKSTATVYVSPAVTLMYCFSPQCHEKNKNREE